MRRRRRATVVTAIMASIPRLWPDRPRQPPAHCDLGQPIARIVEDKDASPAERAIRGINSGVYAFALDGLFDALRGLRSDNAQGEYYLPDLVGVFRRRGLGGGECDGDGGTPDEIQGVNSRTNLAAGEPHRDDRPKTPR